MKHVSADLSGSNAFDTIVKLQVCLPSNSYYKYCLLISMTIDETIRLARQSYSCRRDFTSTLMRLKAGEL